MSTPKLYIDGDPRQTDFVKQLWVIANLIERDTKMYLTSSHFGKVVAEMRAQYLKPGQDYADPPYLIFGKTPELKVHNAGTDTQWIVNAMNHSTPGAIDYQDKLQRLRRA